MTVPTSHSRVQYDGNDAATEFDYTFKIFDADDLVVVLTDSDDNETTLVRGSDYNVDGVGDEAGGTVTYPISGTPLATGETLTILREIPVVQETDLRNQGRFYPETIEDELDRSRMIDQQQQEELGRTLKKTQGGDNYDAGGARIENLGDAFSGQQAVNRRTMEAYVEQIESGPDLTFSNVANMQANENLYIGQHVRTLGYVDIGDGGGNDYEIVAAGTGTDDGGSFIDLSGSGFQAKGLFTNGVNVRQFGGVGSNNIAPAIQAALAYGNFCAILEDDYVFEGEVSIPSDCLIWLHNPRITMTLDGENARGFRFADGTSNSTIVGSARIIAASESLGSDGFRNAVFSWGPDFYVDGTPSGTFNCNIYGQKIEVDSVGSQNIKICSIASYTEDVYVSNVRATGQSNFGFVAHWGGRGDNATLTDATWHPHNIVFDKCEGYKSASGNWLRTFTFSACGRCEVRNSKSESDTIAYNLFVGDYGYTYAQNITEEDQFQYYLNNVEARGPGAIISIDGQSVGFNGSPVWKGSEHRAKAHGKKVFIDGSETSDGLLVAATDIDSIGYKRLEVYDPTDGRAREWFYPQLCNRIYMQATVLHSNRARIRSSGKARLDIDYRKPTPTPDAATFAVAMEGVEHLEVYGTLRDARTGVATISGSGDNKFLKVGADFEDIGLSCVDSDADFTHIAGGNGNNLGTTTTTANIYPYNIKSPLGFIIRGLSVITSEARYIVFVDDVAANGVIDCNYFGDLNAGATNPAAVFMSAATNVYVDPNSNIIAGDVPKLVHP